MSIPPINTTLNNALYSQNTGTTQSNPFITIYSLRDPNINDINYPIQKRWVNFDLVKEWILKSFTNTTGVTTANWVLLNSTGNALLEFTGTTSTTGFPVQPNPAGQINLRSSNSSIVITGDNILHDIDLTLAGGGQAVESIFGDDGIGNSVIPDPSTHAIEFIGTTVAGNNAVNAKPVFFKKNAASAEELDVQVSSQQASGNILKAGLSSFDQSIFLVDSTTGFVTSTAVQPTVSNLGISYSASTFTINAANGSALSATNPGYVTLESNVTPGRMITYKITANSSFVDSTGASTIVGNTFGLTNLVDCSFDVPFFIYAVSQTNDSSVEFMISRFPNSKISPVAAKIAKTGMNTQGSFYSLNAVTAANFASTSCLRIGCFRMVKVGAPATNDWTVSSLTIQDGINQFFEGLGFAVFPGQFGAAAGSLFTNNGGTAPIYANQALTYVFNANNTAILGAAFTNNTTPGVGAVVANLVLPFVSGSGGSIGYGSFVETTGTLAVTNVITTPGTQLAQFVYVDPAASGLILNNQLIANTALPSGSTMGILFS